MEYKLTFEDGSSGYLAHHGIRGMKWGVWNADTSARYKHLNGNNNTKTYANYVKADQKAWRNSNGAYSSPNPVSRLRSNMSQRKLEKARSELADSIIENYAQHPISISPDSNFEEEHKQAVRSLYNRVEKYGWSQNEGLIEYARRVNELENERQIRKAISKGKSAVEHYIQYGTNDRPRSSIEYAADRGVAVSNEKEGNRYRKLATDYHNKNRIFYDLDSQVLRKTGGTVPTEELHRRYPEYKKAARERSKAQVRIDKFENEHRPVQID